MRTFFYIILAGILFSCSSGDFVSYSKKSIKGNPIKAITIREYPFSSLKSNQHGYGWIPSVWDFDTYYLESEYYERVIENTYEKLWEKYQNNTRFLEDSLTSLYPKKKYFKEVNLLTNTTIKFKKFIDEKIDNFSASEESYTLKDIIKPNYYYKVTWYRGGEDNDYNDSPHDRTGYSSNYWIEFQINEKREIIYWKEIDVKILTPLLKK
jgi:hypothetical protein